MELYLDVRPPIHHKELNVELYLAGTSQAIGHDLFRIAIQVEFNYVYIWVSLVFLDSSSSLFKQKVTVLYFYLMVMLRSVLYVW